MALISRLIFSFDSSNVCGLLMKMFDLKKNKSGGVKPGERGGQAISLKLA